MVKLSMVRGGSTAGANTFFAGIFATKSRQTVITDQAGIFAEIPFDNILDFA
jgi:hypothetical protein